MNLRRKIFRPSLREMMIPEFRYFSFKDNLRYNTKIFNGLNFFLVFILSSALFGIFYRPFWALGLSSIILLLFIYFKTLKMAQGISVKRNHPDLAREKEELVVRYQVYNKTSFSMTELNFLEQFDGVSNGFFRVLSKRKIPAHTSLVLNRKIQLNSGMGIKTFKPIILYLTDELGIFTFQIQFYQQTEIEVRPYLVNTPFLRNKISPDSIHFGVYDLDIRGDSILFIGTREYRMGDPVKHINWRLSMKYGKVIINEYEKYTNTYISLFLELDLENQMGRGENSTWELAKDLALSIAEKEIERSNFVQIVANNLIIPFDTGKSHFETIERHFTLHELNSGQKSLFPHVMSDLPRNGQVYYLFPKLSSPKIKENLDYFFKLKGQGHGVVFFTFDPFDFLKKSYKGDFLVGLREMDRIVDQEFLKIEKQCQSAGIPLVTIELKKNLNFRDEILNLGSKIVEER
jgi:uncharacterized protein (DUF58 family)